MSIRLIPLLLLLVSASPGFAQRNRLPPIDQCASDRSFVAFRAQLRAAILRRDRAFLMSVITDDIAHGFASPEGRAGFIADWRLDRPAVSPFWRELDAALRLGCARDNLGQLWVPSMSAPIPDDPDDATYAGNALVIVRGAVLRETPSDRGRILARLDYDVLMLTPPYDSRSVWAEADMAPNVRGYVRRSQIRQFTDWSAVFEKRRGRWRLTSFVRGE